MMNTTEMHRRQILPLFSDGIKSIVVAVDGSEASKNAVLWVTGLAKKLDATVIAVHAETPAEWPIIFPYSAGIRQEDYDRWREGTRTLMTDEWCNPLREAQIAYEPVLRDGSAPVVILEEAQRCHADLVVTGTRGHGGFTGLLLGSVSSHLVHHAPLPVVVIGKGARADLPRTVLAGVDGSPESEFALTWATTLCKSIGARLIVASIWPLSFLYDDDEQQTARRRLEHTVHGLRRQGIDAVAAFESSVAPAGALLEIAQSQSVDLIAVGQRGSSRITEWALGSVSSELTHHAVQPVVIVRTPPADALTAVASGSHFISED